MEMAIAPAFIQIESTIFHLFDVGGQKSERKKWEHCFEDVIQCVVFVASLSSFNEPLYEDEMVNAMDDAFALWESILQWPALPRLETLL